MQAQTTLKYANNIISLLIAAIALIIHSSDTLKATFPTWDVERLISIAILARGFIALVGDMLDDGIINGSFVKIMIASVFGTALFSGCAGLQITGGLEYQTDHGTVAVTGSERGVHIAGRFRDGKETVQLREL